MTEFRTFLPEWLENCRFRSLSGGKDRFPTGPICSRQGRLDGPRLVTSVTG